MRMSALQIENVALRAELATLKSALLKIIANLQDEIGDRDEVIESLENFCSSEIKKLPPEYVTHKSTTLIEEK
jgi:hypothetical protein